MPQPDTIGYVGPPTDGTGYVDKVVIDSAGSVWVCTVAGTPGTWTHQAGGGGSGTVTSVAAADSSIVVGGTPSVAPTIQRAALTGDVTASAGSNATSLASTSNVNTVVGGLASVTAKQAGPLTGDVTTSGAAATLKNTGTAGTTGDATHVAQVTTDAQGRVTTATAVAITGLAESAITNLTTDLAGKQAGPLTGDVTTSGAAATLKNTGGGAAGPLGTATRTNAVTVDAQGRVTALTDQAIAIPESAVTNLTTDLAGKQAGPLTGDVTTSGAAATLATVASAGTTGSGTAVPVVTINAKGLTTGISTAATVGSVAATDATVVVGGTATAPTIQRAALTGDVTTVLNATTLVGTANVESIIRANTLDQLGAPAVNLSMNSKRLTTMGQGVLATDAPDLAQLAGNQMPYVVSGCVWTADAVGSTKNASMTAGTVMVKGILLTVAAVTARVFTASRDTYVDITDNGDGTGLLTYTEVTNNSLSPALSGTVYSTLRNAVLTVGATNIGNGNNICQGNVANVPPTTGAALGSSTVAAGSNTNNITATPLNVASGSSFSTGGGWAQVAHSTQTYTIRYTGVSANTLTGVTVLSGTGTVSTGDTVTQVFPVGLTDLLGNLIYNVQPYPRVIGMAAFANSFTSTSTAAIPIPGLIAPFIVPTGPARSIKLTVAAPVVASSAVAGTSVTFSTFIGNSVSGGTGVSPSGQYQVAVANDGIPLNLAALVAVPTVAGSYTGQMSATQGAAGTLTVSATYGICYLTVELL